MVWNMQLIYIEKTLFKNNYSQTRKIQFMRGLNWIQKRKNFYLSMFLGILNAWIERPFPRNALNKIGGHISIL